VSRLRFSRVFLGSWWGVILLLLNCRLDVWMATVRGTDLAEAHSVLRCGSSTWARCCCCSGRVADGEGKAKV